MVIANCIALQNEIFHEHVLYNTSAMLQQLDIDLWDEAERLIKDPPAGWPRSNAVWLDLRNSAAPKKPLYLSDPSKDFDPDKILFNKELQLQLMMDLAKRKRGIDVSEPLTLEGLAQLNKEWSGLGPFYGQTDRSLEESLQLYNQYLKQIEMTPIEDRKVSQINSTSSEVEESLDSSGGGQTIIIANTTYVSGNNSSSLPVIPKGDNDWVKKYKLYSLAS